MDWKWSIGIFLAICGLVVPAGLSYWTTHQETKTRIEAAVFQLQDLHSKIQLTADVALGSVAVPPPYTSTVALKDDISKGLEAVSNLFQTISISAEFDRQFKSSESSLRYLLSDLDYCDELNSTSARPLIYIAEDLRWISSALSTETHNTLDIFARRNAKAEHTDVARALAFSRHADGFQHSEIMGCCAAELSRLAELPHLGTQLLPPNMCRAN